MVTIRPQKIVDDEFVDQESYTIDLDLPTAGILSTLMLMVKARTATTGVCGGPWIKYLISSISVNQAGQAFLNAARPTAFQSDAYFKTGKMPRRGYDVLGGAASEIVEEVPILFGEGINDLEHTIDLSKLSDPKLSVTYNLATTGLYGETIWDTSYKPRFSVIAHLLQGPDIPVSKGYHSLRQIESYTPTDSQLKKVDLTGLRPIKRIYVQLDLTSPAYGWIHSIDELKLQGDNEAWVPFIQKPDDWYELMRDIFGLCRVNAYVYYVKGGVTTDTIVDKRVYLKATASGSNSIILRPYGGSGRNCQMIEILISDGTGPSTVNRAMYDFVGYVPWTTGVIDMPKMLGLDYLDPTDHKPLYLELDHVSNAATIGGPVRIYVSDLVKPGS